MSTYFKLSDKEMKALQKVMMRRKTENDLMPEDIRATEIILGEVAFFYGFECAPLKEETEDIPIRMAAYLLRQLTPLSLSEIGVLLHKDKAGVLEAIRSMETQLKLGNVELQEAVRTIVCRVKGCYENG